jgi:hypothetical protein
VKVPPGQQATVLISGVERGRGHAANGIGELQVIHDPEARILVDGEPIESAGPTERRTLIEGLVYDRKYRLTITLDEQPYE